jgi:hypothetical protein
MQQTIEPPTRILDASFCYTKPQRISNVSNSMILLEQGDKLFRRPPSFTKRNGSSFDATERRGVA